MGAKADTLAYFSGFLSAIVRAPCPPIECPMIDCLPFFFLVCVFERYCQGPVPSHSIPMIAIACLCVCVCVCVDWCACVCVCVRVYVWQRPVV
jgi:hypothetical protein